MKKKKIAILSLALLGGAMLGGSTLVSAQTNDIKTDILNSLDKVSVYANQTYDQSSPQSILLNDDYALFYDNGNYNFEPRESYMFLRTYSSSNLENNQNSSNLRYNSSQNQNNNEYYVLNSTNKNSNQNTTNKTTSTSQNSMQNSSLNQTNRQNNYASNQNLDAPAKINSVLNQQTQTNTQTTPPENNIVQKTETNKAKTNALDSNQNFLDAGVNQNLINNISSLKNMLKANNENVDARTLRAYSYSLRNIANKLDMCQRDLYKSVSRMMILNSNNTENTLTESANLEIKLALDTKNLLLNYANNVVENLNNLYENNSNNQTNIANESTTTQNTNSQTLNTNSGNNLNTSIKNNSSATNSNSQSSSSANDLNKNKTTPQIVEG
ncbi:MAG: hypothetical protein IJ837_00575 [Clostridia bacterium]|nr:hypothetical protein [Clostridia bacterium]